MKNNIIALSALIATMSVVADVKGIHSFSDLLSDGIVLYAAKHSAEEADEEHPYGHERFETVATLGLAIIIANYTSNNFKNSQ
jgi:divalent metal cation (Fe/Co/Zn/Cd) transporter